MLRTPIHSSAFGPQNTLLIDELVKPGSDHHVLRQKEENFQVNVTRFFPFFSGVHKLNCAHYGMV